MAYSTNFNISLYLFIVNGKAMIFNTFNSHFDTMWNSWINNTAIGLIDSYLMEQNKASALPRHTGSIIAAKLSMGFTVSCN